MFICSRLRRTFFRYYSSGNFVGLPKAIDRLEGNNFYQIKKCVVDDFDQMDFKSVVNKPFVVLGIETSCDDTAVGIVRSDGTIIANIVMSQVCLHNVLYMVYMLYSIVSYT